jgi:hypothetical protein
MKAILIHAALRRTAFTRWIVSLKALQEYILWRVNASRHELPTPAIRKRLTLLDALRAGKLQTVVETGTYLGDTSYFLARHGYSVLTIEVEPLLAELARRRFRNLHNVKVLQGDSGTEIRSVLAELSQPALFWLDGHYSGGATGKANLEEDPALKVWGLFSRTRLRGSAR